MKLRFSRLQGIIVPQAVSSGGDQASPAEIRQMTRRGRLRDLENLHEIPHTQLSIQEQMKNS